MENLHIQGNWKSPTLNFDATKGELSIEGRSLPEHVLNIYQPALDWIEEYGKSPKPETTVNVSLEYFNTSSSKVIFEIFKKLEGIHGNGTNVKVNWYYENDDDDLKEEGETFKELMKVPIELVGIEEFDFVFKP